VENGVFVPSTTLALALAQTLSTKVEDLFYLLE
jgi:DNA-binding XRE family transcriptional regulator